MSWQKLEQKCQLFLQLQHQQQRHRTLVLKSKDTFIDLSSNDYLALARRSELRLRIIRSLVEDYLVGVGKSLTKREHPIHQTLEDEFSKWQSSQASLLVTSGYVANDIVA